MREKDTGRKEKNNNNNNDDECHKGFAVSIRCPIVTLSVVTNWPVAGTQARRERQAKSYTVEQNWVDCRETVQRDKVKQTGSVEIYCGEI